MRFFRLAAAFLAASLLLTACGGDTTPRNRNAALTAQSPLLTRVAAVAAADNSAVVTLSDGTIVRLGSGDDHSTRDIASAVQGMTPVKTRSTYSKAGVLDSNGMLTIRGYEWQRDTPALPARAGKWIDFDFATNGTVAITDDGRVVTKFRGNPPSTPVLRPGASKFVRVEAGSFHAAYLDDLGNAYLVGGDGAVPTLRNGGTKFVDIAANFLSTGFIDDAGNAYLTGWIMNDYVVPPFRDGGTKFVDVEIGTGEAALLDDKGNGYLVAAPVVNPPLNPAPNGSFVAMAAGTNFSLWLDKDGLVTSHSHYAGTAGPGLIQRIPTVPVAAEANSTVIVDDSGTVQQLGSDISEAAPPRTDIVSVGAGANHSLAITATGTPLAWGQNGDGQATVPQRSDFVKVVGGATFSLGLTRSGHIVRWGTISLGSDAFEGIAAGTFSQRVDGLVADVSAGTDHFTVLRRNGSVHSVGAIGRLAPNPETVMDAMRFRRSDISASLAGKPTSNYVAIASHGTCSVAVNNTNGVNNQSLVTWGSCPTSVTSAPRLANVVSLSMGSDHAVALTNRGDVIAWGDNSFGQTTVPEGVSNIVHVDAGTNHTVAVDSSGRVWAWGDNSFGQTTIPENLRLTASEFSAVHEARERLLNAPPAPVTQGSVASPLDAIVPSNAPPAAIAAVQQMIDAAPQTTIPKTTATGLSVKKGRMVTPAQALRLMKVRGSKSPVFVVGKRSRSSSCRITVRRVTMTRVGTCTAVVSHVNAKGKKATSTFVVAVTP